MDTPNYILNVMFSMKTNMNTKSTFWRTKSKIKLKLDLKKKIILSRTLLHVM